MEITSKDLNRLDLIFQENTPAGVKGCEFEIQKILGHLDIGDTLLIKDIGIELKTINEFKAFIHDKYSFEHLDFTDLLNQWRSS